MAKVAKRLQNEGFDICVLFVGSYTRVPEYTSQIKHEMSSNSVFLGEKSNPLEYLKYGGAFGLCSSVEGLPISLIEALGVGAIPICTPVGGIPDVIIDGYNGFLAKDISENGYYEALKRYLQLTTEESNMISENVKKSYSKYSMKECANHYYDFFTFITT